MPMSSDPTNARRQHLFMAGKVFFSAMLLILLFFKVDARQVLQSFRLYSFTTLLLVVSMILVSVFWAALKWQILLPNSAFSQILRLSVIKYFYALVLVGQVTGDIARTYKLGQASPYRISRIAASVVIDRVTGFISLFLVSLLGLSLTRLAIPPILIWSMSILAVSGILSLVILRFRRIQRRLLGLLSFIRRRFRMPRAFHAHLRTFFKALHAYSQHTLLLLLSVLCGAVFQMCCIAATALLARGLSIPVAFSDWCWIFGVITVILFLPVSISGIGLREGSFIGILGYLGIAREPAIALSLSVFSLEVLLGLLGGILELRQQLWT